MRYDRLTFPPYEFREYPKWVTPEGREPVIVHSAEEEAALMAPPKRGRQPKAAAE